jgi:hypothetical protein
LFAQRVSPFRLPARNPSPVLPSIPDRPNAASDRRRQKGGLITLYPSAGIADGNAIIRAFEKESNGRGCSGAHSRAQPDKERAYQSIFRTSGYWF